MNQPDPAEIEAIAARAEAATPGPWEATIVRRGAAIDLAGKVTYPDGHGNYGFAPADAEFIAHARQDIPTLLAALATAEERAEKLASQLAVEQALCADNERQRDEAEQLANEYLAMLCADAKPVEEVVASLRRAAAENDNG